MPRELPELVGQGWKFPLKVNAKGRLNWSEGPERIQDAIWLIIKTSPGERVMRPRFGAGVDAFVFHPNSPATRVELAAAIKNVLLQWEPRIDIEAVRVDPVAVEESQVLVAIEYRLRATNQLFNVVYPLYLEEGVS
jgi:phage baseplate assembly protein W